MSNLDHHKPIPSSVLIFGAAGHIGRPQADYLDRTAPHIQLRLVSSSPARCFALRRDFPRADVVSADYSDAITLRSVVQGMEGVFVTTPSDTEERPAMTSLVSALRDAG